MGRSGKPHPALHTGWACLAALLLTGFASAAEPQDTAQLLKRADGIKTSDNAGFAQLLKQLNDGGTRLTPEQELFRRYLNAWQDIYDGRYEVAISQLDTVIDKSSDPTLRFRAGITAVNALTIASHYQEGYTRLNQLLDLLPQVSDRTARAQGLVVAAVLYNQVGQYDLALSAANKLLRENGTGRSACQGEQLKLEALYKSGKLQADSKEFEQGINDCVKVGEPLYADYIQTFVASLELDAGRPANALKLLQEKYAEVQGLHYARAVSEYDSLLAQAYWQTKDTRQAQEFAQRAIDDGIKNQISKPIVDAYRVLYLIAQQRGDYQAALAFHEKYATADKGYLNDESTKALAFQMVHQQVREKKLQVDALNKENQVLQLRQAVSAKNVEASRLYLLLLLTVLVFIGLFAYRVKRSQLRFMQIARHDGLTGIFNRKHFVDMAEHALAQSKKLSQDASVIVIDLDHFKAVNDAHGHAVGDRVLKCTVAACRTHLRANDLFGRLGGEEFGILMPDCVAATARQIAERIRLAIADCSGSAEGVDFPVRASFGIAGTRMSGYALRQLLIHADNALYQAKREGRDRVVVYDHTKSAGDLPPGVLDRRRG